MDLSKLKAQASSAAVFAGRYLLESLQKKRDVQEKEGLELVSDADLEAQRMLTKRLSSTGIKIVAEEGASEIVDTCWLVDPIDGSTNYIHRLPVFSISIGLMIGGSVALGIVHAPYLGETFTAIRSGGARLNGKAIGVSRTKVLKEGLLATGFPYDLKASKDNNFDHFENFSHHARAIRRMGCASLDLAYVACGRFDGFWEMKLKPWDTAAGKLLVEEAGGKATDFSGKEFELENESILASNGLIHDEMVRTLNR